MAATKTKTHLQAAKARRQKKIVIGGLVLLGILLVIQVPRTMKMLDGGSSTSPAQPTATAAETVTPSDVVAQPVVAPQTRDLPDRNAAPAPQEGQLMTFERFPSKDPFVQQVNDIAASAPALSQATATGGGTAQTAPGSGAATGGPAPAPAATEPDRRLAAVIAVNGSQEQVSVSKTFPAKDPVFVLVSASRTSAKVAIAGGKLADGSGAVTLKLGRQLTLVNTVDGTRYQLTLVSAA